ncbi:MAG: phosphonate ABC transporter, permease protein PhnE [Actinomycetota bacterium]|nr:phosphonate ABC transporter, permease protein PhnE [Actinomycetota bacterium]
MAVAEPALAPVTAGRLSPPWTPRRGVLTAFAFAAVAAFLWAWNHVGMTFSGLLDGAGDVANLVGRMFPPRFDDLDRTIDLAIETFFIALLGTTLATLLSLPLAFLAARNTTPGRAVHGIARAVIVFCRAVPDLVFAVIFVRSVGIGLLPGVLAIALHSVGMIGKLFADAVEQVDEVPRDAVRSTGAGRLQELATAVLPQALPGFIATFLYRLDINVRISVVLGIVGAGGIGFALQNALRTLSYRTGFGIVIVIAVLVIGVELFSAVVRRAIIGDDAITAASRQTRGDRLLARWRPRRAARTPAYDPKTVAPPWTSVRRRGVAYLAAFIVLLAYSFVSVELSPLDVLRGVPGMWETAGLLFPPSLGGLPWADFQEPMLETIAIGVVATVLGGVVGVPIGFLAARNVSPARWVYRAARFGLVLWRSVPELVLAVIFVSAIGLGPVGGTLALSIASVGFLAKLVADAVEEIDAAPREAVLTTGATRLQETATSVVPQALPAMVGQLLYLLDINIRTSTILGIVGGGGIGFLLFNSLRVLRYEVTGAILIMIFVTVYAIERLSGWIRKLLI